MALEAAMRLDDPKRPGMRVSAFIEPCLPSPADRPPSGPGWIHERHAVLTAKMLDYIEGTADFAFLEPEREYRPAPFGRHSAYTIW
jgi:hypothetical protein